jgi:hypothetical protein
MNPFNLLLDFQDELPLLRQLLPLPQPEPLEPLEPIEPIELDFNTVFDDFLNETDTANEDTVTHIIQLDIFNNPLDEQDDLLQYILDFDFDFDDVIPYDSPIEADALFAD